MNKTVVLLLVCATGLHVQGAFLSAQNNTAARSEYRNGETLHTRKHDAAGEPSTWMALVKIAAHSAVMTLGLSKVIRLAVEQGSFGMVDKKDMPQIFTRLATLVVGLQMSRNGEALFSSLKMGPLSRTITDAVMIGFCTSFWN
jgi:hypothetical protein